MKLLMILTVGLCLLFATELYAGDSMYWSDWAGAARSSPEKKHPISVYVVGQSDGVPLTAQEAQEVEAAAAECEKTLTQVTSELEEQYGSKREEWPTEAQTRHDEALRASRIANLATWEGRWFGENKQKDIDDSVEDLKKALRGRGRVRLVESLDSAELIVEVRGRGWEPFQDVFGGQFFGPKGNCNFLGLSVSVGPAIALPAEEAEALAWYNANNYAIAVWKRDADPPRWEIQLAFRSGRTPGMSYRAAANAASFAIERFGDKNYDALEVGRQHAASPRPE